MNVRRAVSLGARVVCGTAWAMCLTVLGLSLLFEGPPISWLGGHRVRSALGVAAVAAGLFVFMAMVADRLVPQVGRRMTMWPVEATMIVLFLGGFAAAVVIFLGGAQS